MRNERGKKQTCSDTKLKEKKKIGGRENGLTFLDNLLIQLHAFI
jgi:hypothetical protein